jgi:hypothetical protein
VTALLFAILLLSWLLLALEIVRRPHHLGEFDDIDQMNRKLAALARARKDHP